VNQPECQEDIPFDASLAAVHPQIEGAEKNRDLCIFPDFEEAQIEQLISLTKDILARNPDIEPTAIIGHSDIAKKVLVLGTTQKLSTNTGLLLIKPLPA
jgi:N-acetylmuramoyl-L-alanine amidase